MADGDSVTQWLADLKGGDESAAQQLWDRYFCRLAALARVRLQGIARLPADGEDVALSAIHSLWEGVGNGQFQHLSDRDSLWKLLVAITVRKAGHVIRDELRLKRGGGRLVGESVLMDPGESSDGVHGLELVLDREPPPDLAVQLEEEVQKLLDLLPDEELRQIAVWKMQGATSASIAVRLDKALATIERRLKLIRSLWESHS